MWTSWKTHSTDSYSLQSIEDTFLSAAEHPHKVHIRALRCFMNNINR